MKDRVDEKPELKPCPFCGGEAVARPNLPTYGCEVMYYVFCGKCLVRTQLKWTAEQAIEVWNRRAEDEKPR